MKTQDIMNEAAARIIKEGCFENEARKQEIISEVITTALEDSLEMVNQFRNNKDFREYVMSYMLGKVETK
jgi:hypothetical protein